MRSTPPIVLRISDKDYSGWRSIRVTRSIEALAGSFSLNLAESFSKDRETNRNRLDEAIADNAECSVLIDGAPVVTGFIDKVSRSFSPGEHSVTVTGRDRAADLVDCSVQLGAWSFANAEVLALAKKICAPYKVNVTLQAGLLSKTETHWVEIVKGKGVTAPKKYSIDPGDTAADALDNLLKLAGLLRYSDGLGGLVLSRTGTERLATVLVEGQNILRASSTFDTSNRFRHYEVMGSHKGSDEHSGASAAAVKGTATDFGARAGRTFIIRPSTGVSRSLAKSRAEWEASVRAARGESVSVTVQGWAESAFEPVWPLNKLVRVRSPLLRLNSDALIAGVTPVARPEQRHHDDPRPAKPGGIRVGPDDREGERCRSLLA